MSQPNNNNDKRKAGEIPHRTWQKPEPPRPPKLPDFTRAVRSDGKDSKAEPRGKQ